MTSHRELYFVLGLIFCFFCAFHFITIHAIKLPADKPSLHPKEKGAPSHDTFFVFPPFRAHPLSGGKLFVPFGPTIVGVICLCIFYSINFPTNHAYRKKNVGGLPFVLGVDYLSFSFYFWCFFVVLPSIPSLCVQQAWNNARGLISGAGGQRNLRNIISNIITIAERISSFTLRGERVRL